MHGMGLLCGQGTLSLGDSLIYSKAEASPLFVCGEVLPHLSSLLAANISLRNGLGKEQVGALNPWHIQPDL